MAGAEGPAGRQSELEPVVSLVDVLEEDEELENEACAVLGGSDSEKCSYSQVGARRGPRLPWAPAEPALPDRTWTDSRLPRPASQWWSEAAVRRRLPRPRPSCPNTPSVLAPFLSLGPTGPPSSSIFVRPLRILQALALEQLLSFLSRLPSVCPGCFSRNRPRDLSNPDIFVFTFPILRVFIGNRMGGSKQS